MIAALELNYLALQAYQTHFHIRTRLASLSNTAGTCTVQDTVTSQLRSLAEMAIDAYIHDVRELVRAALESARRDMEDHDPNQLWMKTRLTNHERWKKVDKPLDWGSERQTYATLVRVVSPTEEDHARGLPKSPKHSCSPRDFVDRLYKAGTSLTANGVRAPLWNKGACWPILRTIISECQARVLKKGAVELSEDDENDIKQAFEHAVQVRAIHFFPDHAERGHQPSAASWTMLTLANRSTAGSGRSMLISDAGTSRTSRHAIHLAQVSEREMSEDVHAEWKTLDIMIHEYHRYMDRVTLPTNWGDPESITAGGDLCPLVYAWGDEYFRNNMSNWRCQLAMALAFLTTKILPHIHWPNKGSKFNDVVKLLDQIPPGREDDSISLMRRVDWIKRPTTKGASDQSIYLMMLSVNLLAWMVPDSPLRLELAAKGHLPEVYVKKHSLFSIPRDPLSVIMTCPCF